MCITDATNQNVKWTQGPTYVIDKHTHYILDSIPRLLCLGFEQYTFTLTIYNILVINVTCINDLAAHFMAVIKNPYSIILL